VSFDLVVLSGAKALDADRAQEIYEHLCEGEPWDRFLIADPRIADFVHEITRRWPQVDDMPPDEVERSPWSVQFDVSLTHVISAMVWSKADEVAPVYVATALKHGLNVFDPQEGILHSPGMASRSSTPRRPAPRICARCRKPIDPSELTAELPGAEGLYHLGCMLSDWPPGSRN